MRAHHEQAVQMAFIYLGLPDTDPGLQTVARSIVVGQKIEIGRMIQMLRDMGPPEAAETDEAMAWMGHAMPATQMPGMATDAQLEQLAASSGRGGRRAVRPADDGPPPGRHRDGRVRRRARRAGEGALDGRSR